MNDIISCSFGNPALNGDFGIVHVFKKLQAHDNLWSVRINEQYRAVGVRSGDTIEWIWVGTHNEFDNLFS